LQHAFEQERDHGIAKRLAMSRKAAALTSVRLASLVIVLEVAARIAHEAASVKRLFY
jgi:hypothetical protein